MKDIDIVFQFRCYISYLIFMFKALGMTYEYYPSLVIQLDVNWVDTRKNILKIS